MSEATPQHVNHLANESSPYLLQHAHNPVDWYAWGAAAFERAKREDKPIFLSVGYSTCHWCHVMAHESFEDERVAAVMNEHFVCIKVDREELPDVDEQYMLATQLFTRRGGWPNSVWLTPDGRPWYAGTYFPKEDRGGRAGFISVLTQLDEAWRGQREQVEKQADQFADAIRQAGGSGADTRDDAERDALRDELITKAIAMFRRAHDDRNGGFGSAPKFPPHGMLALLLQHAGANPDDAEDRRIIGRTLDAMALGGIHDHVGGGFHRYSTDARWFLPHFEKMLYDNAQLMRAYTDAHALTSDERYAAIAADIFGWIEREMTDAAGGFYCALDADSEGEEGKCYLWRYDELIDALGEADGAWFAERFNATKAGTYYEEATGHRPGTNLLYLTRAIEDGEQERVEAMKAKLLAIRTERVQPHLDDKVLSGWNGLMIGALAHAGAHLGEARYTQAAARAADFVLREMRDDRGGLMRSWRAGAAKQPGYLDDYAFVAEAMLELHAATGEAKWLDTARDLTEQMIARFYDVDGGGFYFTEAGHDALLMRSKELGGGGNMPSGNGAAASVLTRLAKLGGDIRYGGLAEQTLTAFAGAMASQPHGAERLLTAYGEMRQTQPPRAGAIAEPIAAAVNVEDDADGRTIALRVEVVIGPGWHVYAHDAAGEGDAARAATALSAVEDTGWALVSAAYPPGHVMRDAGGETSVYAGRVTIAATARRQREDATVDGLRVRLRVQACDDRRCLAARVLEMGVGSE